VRLGNFVFSAIDIVFYPLNQNIPKADQSKPSRVLMDRWETMLYLWPKTRETIEVESLRQSVDG